jgi:hypothetical protein
MCALRYSHPRLIVPDIQSASTLMPSNTQSYINLIALVFGFRMFAELQGNSLDDDLTGTFVRYNDG